MKNLVVATAGRNIFRTLGAIAILTACSEEPVTPLRPMEPSFGMNDAMHNPMSDAEYLRRPIFRSEPRREGPKRGVVVLHFIREAAID